MEHVYTEIKVEIVVKSVNTFIWVYVCECAAPVKIECVYWLSQLVFVAVN